MSTMYWNGGAVSHIPQAEQAIGGTDDQLLRTCAYVRASSAWSTTSAADVGPSASSANLCAPPRLTCLDLSVSSTRISRAARLPQSTVPRRLFSTRTNLVYKRQSVYYPWRTSFSVTPITRWNGWPVAHFAIDGARDLGARGHNHAGWSDFTLPGEAFRVPHVARDLPRGIWCSLCADRDVEATVAQGG